MRGQRLILYVFTSLGLLFCLQLAACGSQGISGSQGANGNPQACSKSDLGWDAFSVARCGRNCKCNGLSDLDLNERAFLFSLAPEVN
jgi:hypothetical protein